MSKIYPNQIECANKIFNVMNDPNRKGNYIIVKGCTQSGKTGVFQALVNIIATNNMCNFKKIYCITGDNTTSLTNQTTKRLQPQSELCYKNSIELIIWKNSDLRKDYNRNEYEDLTDSLIFIDESHFGTAEEKNILIKWLIFKGLNMNNNCDLINKNTYIISNSATPYNEIASDFACNKEVIFYSPAEGYIGINSFISKNIFKLQDNNNETVLNALKNSYNHLRKIEKKTKKIKCFFARMTQKQIDYCSDEINDLYDVHIVECKNNKKIDIESVENKIFSYSNGLYDDTRNDKYLLVIIKGSYRMGVSITPKIKRLIGGIYDVSNNVVTTEQGLLGRVCGYNWGEDYKDLIIYTNANSFTSLSDYYSIDINTMENINECIEEKLTTTTPYDDKEKVHYIYYGEDKKNENSILRPRRCKYINGENDIEQIDITKWVKKNNIDFSVCLPATTIKKFLIEERGELGKYIIDNNPGYWALRYHDRYTKARNNIVDKFLIREEFPETEKIGEKTLKNAKYNDEVFKCMIDAMGGKKFLYIVRGKWQYAEKIITKTVDKKHIKTTYITNN